MDKLSLRAVRCIFLGYSRTQKRVYTGLKALQTPCAPEPFPTPMDSAGDSRLPRSYYNWKKAMDEETLALLTRVVNKDWLMYQLDIKNAFLYGDLTEEVCMEQPLGFVAKTETHLVCKLKKAIYGLKQSPRAWFDKFSQVVFAAGFCDATVIEETKKYLQQQFVTKDLGNLRYVLGIEVAHGKQDVLMEPNLDLWKEDEDFEDSAQYRRLVGKLIYLTVTRPGKRPVS
ncbi:Retrovirus-related Pol polyprotein from transposon RE1 [Vitis vinifera]|uniref:Retrovirus-related Pol polyprotein from transposon RE1 n=1 Tax=Vitis vinifera TaxID=29760 RepID=A0A438JSN4_VITVI|nr:Retrovirus-related Pol polyprotein from transposon RE1 [Vitis vinifera]